MFNVKPYKAIIIDLHKIVDNFIVLFNDGDNDVIYTGTNSYGNRILGVIMFEDDENGYLRYMHLLLTEEQYINYINKERSLLNLIQTNQSLFIIDKEYNGMEISANLVHIDDIPIDFLPLENSFCPDFINDPSFSYAISLKGRKADLHITRPEDLNIVNTHISAFLRSATQFLSNINLQREIYVEALPTGSFRIKFKIELNKNSQIGLFDIPTSQLSDFLNDFLVYILERLPSEAPNIFKSESINSLDFTKLQQSFSQLFTAIGIKPQANLEQLLIDSMAYSIEHLKCIDYNQSFEKIEFINYSKSGTESPIAIIDETFIPAVIDKFHKVEKPHDVIEYDQAPQKYSIQVYSLNKESGNGSAYLSWDNGISRVGLHLKGRDNYQNTVFTRNMDEENAQLIEIMGIAKRINGKIKEITYTYAD